jgi:diketogulonate reductase-like aldo/keto reductase
MPVLGYGTWHLSEGDETERAVRIALATGYRLIDTAKLYGNEGSVGQAIATSGVPREDIFVTTKLWNDDLGYESGIEACQQSVERLALDYIDLYLIHWPANEARHDAWRALIELQKRGLTRAIGVSNYSIKQLKEATEKTGVKPAVNQIEFHLYNYTDQIDVLEYCQAEGIAVQAYSPLARGRRMDNMLVENIAADHDKSAAQVMLRWCIQHGTVPLPKSANEKRIMDNFEIFDFELSNHEMDTLDSISL